MPVPVLLIATIGSTIIPELLKLIGKKKGDAWDQFSGQQKSDFVSQALAQAFSMAGEYKTTPEEIFKQIIKQVETEDDYGTWYYKANLENNRWVERRIASREKMYNMSFKEVPQTPTEKSLTAVSEFVKKNKAVTIGVAIVLGFIILRAIFK